MTRGQRHILRAAQVGSLAPYDRTRVGCPQRFFVQTSRGDQTVNHDVHVAFHPATETGENHHRSLEYVVPRAPEARLPEGAWKHTHFISWCSSPLQRMKAPCDSGHELRIWPHQQETGSVPGSEEPLAAENAEYGPTRIPTIQLCPSAKDGKDKPRDHRR